MSEPLSKCEYCGAVPENDCVCGRYASFIGTSFPCSEQNEAWNLRQKRIRHEAYEKMKRCPRCGRIPSTVCYVGENRIVCPACAGMAISGASFLLAVNNWNVMSDCEKEKICPKKKDKHPICCRCHSFSQMEVGIGIGQCKYGPAREIDVNGRVRWPIVEDADWCRCFEERKNG